MDFTIEYKKYKIIFTICDHCAVQEKRWKINKIKHQTVITQEVDFFKTGSSHKS